jgi:hypothetical protein
MAPGEIFSRSAIGCGRILRSRPSARECSASSSRNRWISWSRSRFFSRHAPIRARSSDALNGFAQVIVGPLIDAADHGLHVAERGDHHHGDMAQRLALL